MQVTVLKLLAELRRSLGMAYVFVSHDLNVIRLLCDRVVVMYLGRVMEAGPAQAVFDRPLHPYTASLIAALPRFGGDRSDAPPPRASPAARSIPTPTPAASTADAPAGPSFAARRCRPSANSPAGGRPLATTPGTRPDASVFRPCGHRRRA